MDAILDLVQKANHEEIAQFDAERLETAARIIREKLRAASCPCHGHT